MEIEPLSRKFFEYSQYIKGFSPDTIIRYKRVIKYYCNHTGVSTIENITIENLRMFFLNGRIQRRWQDKTFICYFQSLSVFFQWCMVQGYFANNPLDGIELPKAHYRLPSKLTKQDALKLLEVAYNYPYEYPFLRSRNHAMFSMFVFAGLRRSELLGLRFTDVDVDNMTIFIRQGKGGKDRIIPMSFTLAESLKRYMKERRRLDKTCAEFFTSLTRNKGLTKVGLKYLVVQMSKASGIKFTIHKLRHTFATLMLEGGCDIYSLSRMMGYSDIKTTTIYLSASAEHLRSQVRKHPLNELVRLT